MRRKNNTFTIVIVGVVAVTAGIMIGNSSKNKGGAPAAVSSSAVDSHGHSIAPKIPAAPLAELIGKPAPDFSLADRNGKMYSLNELKGKNVILFFNEGLMCYPACWNQIVSLAKDERFKNNDIVALSVVVDPPKDWQGAIDKMPELAEATVVFDEGAKISRAFGVLTAGSSMHYGSLPGHTYVVIDKEGIIRHMFDDPRMAIHNDELAVEFGKLN